MSGSTLESDIDGYDYHPRVCRGKRLVQLLEEIAAGGWKTNINAVGGFSGDLTVCKSYANGTMGTRAPEGPPAVYHASAWAYTEQEPNFQPVQYTEEWLNEHPDVAHVCQTIPGFERPLEDEIGSTIWCKWEKEWVALDTNLLKPLEYRQPSEDGTREYVHRGELNIYLSKDELERMNVIDKYNLGLPGLCNEMRVAKAGLEKLIPADLPVKRVRLYYCDYPPGSFSVSEGSSKLRCQLHGDLTPKGRPMSEGIDKSLIYLPWTGGKYD